MLITDYSPQTQASQDDHISLTEVATAGFIFVLPVIFLLLISAS